MGRRNAQYGPEPFPSFDFSRLPDDAVLNATETAARKRGTPRRGRHCASRRRRSVCAIRCGPWSTGGSLSRTISCAGSGLAIGRATASEISGRTYAANRRQSRRRRKKVRLRAQRKPARVTRTRRAEVELMEMK
jgi:hypothetical protein